MPKLRSLTFTLLAPALAIGVAGSPALAGGKAKPAPAAKAPPAKKAPAVNEENKKKLLGRMGTFKFGMSKDEVLAQISKQLDEQYEEKIKAATDVLAKDRLRNNKKRELDDVKRTYAAIDTNAPSPWDASIVEGEFAHGTDEAVMDRWENQNGKNERRVFFFYQGKLWKMFISMDLSVLPEDKKNFETFQAVMQGQYGPALVEPGVLTWSTSEFKARAVDKLKIYDALGLTLESPAVEKEVLATREAKAPPKKEMSSVIRAVVDDKHEAADTKANSGAVDSVIKAQGTGGGTAPKKK